MKLLDADICIDVLRCRPEVDARFLSEIETEELAVPIIVVHELWYGVATQPRRAQTLHVFLADRPILPFGSEDAAAAAGVRAQLREDGALIGALDILIVGQALARSATLVTGNTRHFSRVRGLTIEDWREAQSA